MTSKPKSWCDVLEIHPAAELFPMMSVDELQALGEDIQQHGLHEGIALLDGKLLDGRNRLDAMEMVGIKVVTGTGKLDVAFRNVKPRDPVDYVLSKNFHRRHLSADQKRELITKVLKATPEKSNRQIAEAVKVSHVTVGNVRSELGSTGQIDQLTKTVGKDGRKRCSSKPRNAKQPHKPKQPHPIEEVSTSFDDAINATVDQAVNAMRDTLDKPAVVEELTEAKQPQDPIFTLTAEQVRVRVAAAMGLIEPRFWPALIAKLHEELDRMLHEPAQAAE